MAFINAQSTRVLYGNTALAGYLRSVSPSAQIDMLDVTVLTDTAKQFIPALGDYTLNVDGLFDNTTGAGSLWDVLTSPINAGSTIPTTIGVDGYTVGNSVWMIPARTVSFEVSSSVADVVGFTASFGSASATNLGVSLADLAARTTTANGTSVDSGAATSNGAVAHLHITNVAGTTPSLTVTVEHSTNGSSWTTLGSFTAASTASSELITVTGTVNRYTRAVFTIAGTTPSFTCQVSLARL